MRGRYSANVSPEYPANLHLALELALFRPDKRLLLVYSQFHDRLVSLYEIINADGRKLTLPQDDQRSEVRNGSSLCENVREQRMRRIVFSLFLFRLRLPVLFFSCST